MAILTKEEIFVAADELVNEGVEKPRVLDVRNKLGRGSMSTITDAMKEWRQQSKPVEPVEQEVTPKPIVDRLTALGTELWSQARAAAEEGLEKEREALESYRAEMDDQQQETAEYADALNEANEALKERNAEQLHHLEVLHAEKNSLSNLLKTTSDQLIAAETREQSISKHLEDLRELLAEREAERDSTAQTVRQQAEEVSRLREELAAIKERQKIAEQQLVEERAGIKDLQVITEQRLADERAAREQAQKNFEGSREREQAAEVKAAKLEGEVNALRAQVTASSKAEAAKTDKTKQ